MIPSLSAVLPLLTALPVSGAGSWLASLPVSGAGSGLAASPAIAAPLLAAMPILAALPWLAFAAALAGVVAGILAVRGQTAARDVSRWAMTVAAAITAVAFAALVILFVYVRTEYSYVFLYTSDSIPLRYRIAGAWAGREGSMLLWALYAAIVAAGLAWWHSRRPGAAEDGPTRGWTELGVAAIAAAFLGAVAWQGTFAPTEAFFLRNRPEGNGLNPTLLSPFILIHPPIMFLAYALTAVPAAAVIGDLVTGRRRWSTVGMLWSRIDWVLYTVAMGLGGIWAYYTLGFGGYWAWDPVEVANLLPWLALTVFLHAQLHHRRYGRYNGLAPLLGVLPFLLTLFSTISTRSGLWVSVHAFTDPSETFDPDGASRFLAILQREPSLQFHAGLFLAVMLGFLALWCRRLAIDNGELGRTSRIIAGVLGAAAVVGALAPRTLVGLGLEAGTVVLPGRPGFALLAVTSLAFVLASLPMLLAEPEKTSRLRLDLRTFALASIAILGVGLLVLFLWHMAAIGGWSEALYLRRFPFLATPVLLGLILFQAHGLHGRDAWYVAGGAWLLAFAAAAFASRSAGAYLLVLTVVLVVLSTRRVLATGALKRLPRSVAAGRTALWIAALLDVVFWLNPPAIRLGAWVWEPVWPTQLFMGAAAFLALHLATRLLAGRTRHAGRTHLLVGALGAFYIAPVIAAASWWAHRRDDGSGISSPGPRMHQAGLYGVHFAVAIVLLGYAASTYFGHESTEVMALDDEVVLAGSTATLTGVEQGVEGGRIERLEPMIRVDSGQATKDVAATFYWEPQTQSHFPLPGTARFWDRDVYFAVDSVCIDPQGACQDNRDWVDAYQAGSQLPDGVTVTQIEVQASELPGLGLVWAALFLFAYFMGLIIWHGPERP